MARIAINDIQESQSFLTELNHTDVAMDQINGGFFFFFFPFFFKGFRFKKFGKKRKGHAKKRHH